MEALNAFDKDALVTIESLKEKGIVKNKYDSVKILGEGELKKALNVKVAKVSDSARQKIEAAGGKVEEL